MNKLILTINVLLLVNIVLAIPYGGVKKHVTTTTTTKAPEIHYEKIEPKSLEHQHLKQYKKSPPKKVHHEKEIVTTHEPSHKIHAPDLKTDEKIYFKSHRRSPRFAGGFGGSYGHFNHRGRGGHGHGYYDSSSSEFQDYHWKPVKFESVNSAPTYHLNKPVFTNLPEPDDHYPSYYHQSHSFDHKPSNGHHHGYYGHGPDDDCFDSSEEISYFQPKPEYKPSTEAGARPVAASPSSPSSPSKLDALFQIKETIKNVKKVVKDAVVETKKPETFLKPLNPKSMDDNVEVEQDKTEHDKVKDDKVTDDKAEDSTSDQLDTSRKIEHDTQEVKSKSFNPPLIERTKPLELAPEIPSKVSSSQNNEDTQEVEPKVDEEGEQDTTQDNRELPENPPSGGVGAQEEIPEEIIREVFPDNPELTRENNEDSMAVQESDNEPSEDQVNIDVRNEDQESTVTPQIPQTIEPVLEGVNPRR